MLKPNILCIGAHPDDIEIGMGGTVASLLGQGHSVSLLDLTNGEPTPKGSHEKRIKESQEASQKLGANERVTLNLENRFLQDTPDARKLVAAEIRRLKPEILFIPYWIDAHPDHVEASKLSEAARFTAKLTKTDIPGDPHYPSKVFYYFCLHLSLTIKPSFILDISPFMKKKLDTITSYRSQFQEQNKEGYIENKVSTLGRHWGQLIKRDYGEAFLCREEIGLTGLAELVY